MSGLRKVVHGVVDGASGAAGAPGVVARLSEKLLAAGIPIDRVAAFVRTLHPPMGVAEPQDALAPAGEGPLSGW